MEKDFGPARVDKILLLVIHHQSVDFLPLIRAKAVNQETEEGEEPKQHFAFLGNVHATFCLFHSIM